MVYGLLTVVLGLGYVGAVLLLREMFGSLAGQSSLALAGSTLAMAALFSRPRRCIQHAVDLRFNRRRYDPAATGCSGRASSCVAWTPHR